MFDDERDVADALATADTALVDALRAGDAETALAWARTRNELLERLAARALAGVESARALLLGARAANDELERPARAERDRVVQELGLVQAQRRLQERVRHVDREEPRFVSRLA
jgi:hypothetical protein